MPCVLVAGIFAAVVPLEAPAPACAAFDYNIEQIAPAIASQLTMADIAAILNETVNNPSSWEVFQLATTDASGHQVSVAPLKLVHTDSTVCRRSAATTTRSTPRNLPRISVAQASLRLLASTGS